MKTFRVAAVGLALLGALFASRFASAEQFYVLYCDSGIAWRIGLHDHEAQRQQIELDYAADVQAAKDDFTAAINAADAPGVSVDDQQQMTLAANQRLQDDLQAAEDRRIARMDSIYPNRWDQIDQFPDLIVVGYDGPCHFCSLDLEGNSIAWISFLLPYPGFNRPCLFGWHWGDRHQFQDIRPARAAFRAHREADLRLHPRSQLNVAFRNANQWAQTRHRADRGKTQAGDIQFLSDHHLPPTRTNPPVTIPRATRRTGSGSTGHAGGYVPRANGNTNSKSRGGAGSTGHAGGYVPRANGNRNTKSGGSTRGKGGSNQTKGRGH